MRKAHGELDYKKVAQAIIDSHGIITEAARKLDCTPVTVYRHIDRYKTVQNALDTARNQMIDRTEARLFELIDEKDFRAIKLYLTTIGKDRGYYTKEQKELTGKDDGEIRIKVISGVSMDDL